MRKQKNSPRRQSGNMDQAKVLLELPSKPLGSVELKPCCNKSTEVQGETASRQMWRCSRCESNCGMRSIWLAKGAVQVQDGLGKVLSDSDNRQACMQRFHDTLPITLVQCGKNKSCGTRIPWIHVVIEMSTCRMLSPTTDAPRRAGPSVHTATTQ